MVCISDQTTTHSPTKSAQENAFEEGQFLSNVSVSSGHVYLFSSEECAHSVRYAKQNRISSPCNIETDDEDPDNFDAASAGVIQEKISFPGAAGSLSSRHEVDTANFPKVRLTAQCTAKEMKECFSDGKLEVFSTVMESCDPSERSQTDESFENGVYRVEVKSSIGSSSMRDEFAHGDGFGQRNFVLRKFLTEASSASVTTQMIENEIIHESRNSAIQSIQLQNSASDSAITKQKNLVISELSKKLSESDGKLEKYLLHKFDCKNEIPQTFRELFTPLTENEVQKEVTFDEDFVPPYDQTYPVREIEPPKTGEVLLPDLAPKDSSPAPESDFMTQWFFGFLVFVVILLIADPWSCNLVVLALWIYLSK